MDGEIRKFLPMTNARYAMSVDVEDYFQVWAFSGVIPRTAWDGFAPRVGAATRRCLDIFDRHGVKATFFTLGWVGERDPDLVRDIVASGHELASHGYDHTKVCQQNKSTFFEDVSKTKALLEDIAGVAVKGYRAPGFSINTDTPWAHDALLRAGYAYSSSTHPIRHDHYGDPHAPRAPYKPIADANFLEAPVATLDVLGRRISCAGGGWFRAMPVHLSRAMLKSAGETLGGPAIFYFHPWEMDSEQPRIRRAPMKSKLRHYLNLNAMSAKLDVLLKTFSWGRVDDALCLELA